MWNRDLECHPYIEFCCKKEASTERGSGPTLEGRLWKLFERLGVGQRCADPVVLETTTSLPQLVCGRTSRQKSCMVPWERRFTKSLISQPSKDLGLGHCFKVPCRFWHWIRQPVQCDQKRSEDLLECSRVCQIPSLDPRNKGSCSPSPSNSWDWTSWVKGDSEQM